MAMVDVEREFIARGYRIKYRAPDLCCDDPPAHDLWTYQLERGDWTGGFRATEEALDQAIPDRLVEYIERHNGWPRTRRTP